MILNVKCFLTKPQDLEKLDGFLSIFLKINFD